MNVEPVWQAADEIWSRMRSLLEELLSAPSAPRAPRVVPPAPGIYLFSDGSRYRYVGQTRNLRARLGQHTRPNGTHYTATLAFLMAVERAEADELTIEGQRRAARQDDPAFVVHFDLAKAEVASWNVQYIEVESPLVRTLFEVYVHLTLNTDLNSFETH